MRICIWILSSVLALDTYGPCLSNAGGYAAYEHFYENRLEIAPDILARLGVMRPEDPDARMESSSNLFPEKWHPGQPLVLKRHKGEQSIFNLIVAVCHLVERSDAILCVTTEETQPFDFRL
jgi:hypothetical protein